MIGYISMNDEYYYTFDGNGNTSELTDGAAAKVNSYAYEPFGEVLASSELVGNEFQFVGQFGVRQAGNDLLYMRNRFYSPGMGRFISEDPIGLAGGINLYAYVLNDPVNWVDPEGLDFWDTIKSIKKWYNRINTINDVKNTKEAIDAVKSLTEKMKERDKKYEELLDEITGDADQEKMQELQDDINSLDGEIVESTKTCNKELMEVPDTSINP